MTDPFRNSADAADSIEDILNNRFYAFYVRQWIDYKSANQNRVKLLHDIRLKDGSEHESYYPNGNSWSKWSPAGTGPARVADDQVSHIRISLKQIGD